MAFIFDATLKGATSNSYVTIATADDYFGGHPKNSLWSKLTTLQKQQLLVRATTRLNLETYAGRRSTSTQRLQFPRTWLVSRDFMPMDDMLDFVNGSYYQSADTNPMELEQATCELALFYLEEWIEESPMFSRGDMDRMESIEIGPLKASLRKTKEDALPDIVKRLLRAIGPDVWQGQGQLKVVR